MKQKILPFLGFFLIYIICVIIISPTGEFPLCDDWAFYKGVKIFLETNKIVLIQAMSLVSQIFWGVLVSKLFGFSFSVLRISVLVLSFIGVSIFYLILRKYKIRRLEAFLFSLLLLFNPFYFNLSYSFMTDVPHLVCLLLAFFLFFKAKENSKNKKGYLFITLGSLSASVALLIRQPAVMLAIGMCIWFVIFDREDLDFWKVLILCIPYFVMGVFYFWYIKIHGPTELYKWQQGALKGSIKEIFLCPGIGFKRMFGILNYPGLFLCPLFIAFSPYFLKEIKNRVNVIIPLFLAIFSLTIYQIRNIGCALPLELSNLHNFGLGIVRGLVGEGSSHFSIDSYLFWSFINFISISGAVFIFYSIITSIKNIWKDRHNPYLFFAFIIIIAFLLFLVIFPPWYDRYTLMLFPWIILVIVYKYREIKFNLFIYNILLIPIIAFSMISTYDYLSWNRTKWQAIGFLKDIKKIPLREIDGGGEYNYWNFWDKDIVRSLWRIRSLPPLWYEKQYNDSSWNKAIEIGEYGFPIWGYIFGDIKTKAKWIWYSKVEDNTTVVFRKIININTRFPVQTEVKITCDDSFMLWINNKKIIKKENGLEGEKIKVPLRNGDLITVLCWNNYGEAGLFIEIDYGMGKICSDNSWKVKPLFIPVKREDTWWGKYVRDTYVISMAPIEGYRIYKKYNYKTLLKDRNKGGYIYILKKIYPFT